MVTHPLFSIITITFNAGSTLKPTLESVSEQTFDNFEYIIIDGASTDNTQDIISEYQHILTHTVSERDKGLYDAMNKGLKLATGEYLIFLNAGDAFHDENTLKILAGYARETKHPDILYGETALVNAERKFTGMRRLKSPEKLSWKSFRNGMLVCHQAFIVRRVIAPEYDLTYRFSADYDWCIRCMKKADNIINTHTTLIDYLNEGMTTKNRKLSLKERYRIMVIYYGSVTVALWHIWFAIRFFTARLTGKE